MVFLLVLGFEAWGQTLHRGLGPEPDSLDIHTAQGLNSINVLRDLHEGLVTFDGKARIIPGVASEWELDDDGRTWRFKLDPQARWSDGSRVTGKDFVRGWHRALDPITGAPYAAMLDGVENARAVREGDKQPGELGIEVLSDGRLEIRLETDMPWFTELLTHPVTFPLPEGENADERRRFNGPFVLAEHRPGSHLRLKANKSWRLADEVRLDEVIWHPIEDPVVEMNRYRAGELHITETIPPGRKQWLRERFGDELRISPYLGSFFLGYNLSREPFENRPKLREALSLVVDRQLIAERVIGAGEVPAWRLVPPGMEGWPDRPGPGQELDTEQRLDRARKLYQEAGYGPGNPLQLELRYNTTLTHRRMAAAVAALWKQHLGVETRLVNEEWKVFVVNRRQGRLTQVMRGGWIADWADPANFLQLFVSDSPLNYTFFSDETFDDLMDRAAASQGEERMELLFDAEEQLLESHAIIPLYYYVSRHLVRSDVDGFEDNLMDVHLSRWMGVGNEP